MTVSGRRSGRLSVAGLIAMRPGSRTRLCHRLRTHPAVKGARRSMSERDFIDLVDGVHQLVRAPIVLVWDRLNTHVSRRMRGLVAEREWLTVFLLPAYSPDLNPVEWVWAHVKRSLANLAVMALDRLEALVRNRLKRLQYRPHTLDGFIAVPASPSTTQLHPEAPKSVSPDRLTRSPMARAPAPFGPPLHVLCRRSKSPSRPARIRAPDGPNRWSSRRSGAVRKPPRRGPGRRVKAMGPMPGGRLPATPRTQDR